MADVVALLARRAELMKVAKHEEDPMTRVRAKCDLIEVDIALSWPMFDFLDVCDADGPEDRHALP